tara:strand:+ start:459 stop:1223 length:765 start_codon:yes stop_codon:yes gene_type:complete
MDKIFIFDVDGTLTPSRQKMAEEFARFFDEWTKKNTYYLVTGSDLEKTREQVPLAYMDRAHGIFTCCGNEYWQNDPAVHPMHCDLIYENKFKPPNNLLTYLGEQIRMSDYPVKVGNHIEDRGSLLNFSIVGRNCSQVQRNDYYEYDTHVHERKDIADYIKKNWSDLDAVLGGQISIDIYPKGMDKSQILDIIKQEILVEPSEYIFIGDRTEKGGNDYPLAKLMKKTQNCKYHQVEDYRKTWWLLQRYELGLENK